MRCQVGTIDETAHGLRGPQTNNLSTEDAIKNKPNEYYYKCNLSLNRLNQIPCPVVPLDFVIDVRVINLIAFW